MVAVINCILLVVAIITLHLTNFISLLLHVDFYFFAFKAIVLPESANVKGQR